MNPGAATTTPYQSHPSIPSTVSPVPVMISTATITTPSVSSPPIAIAPAKSLSKSSEIVKYPTKSKFQSLKDKAACVSSQTIPAIVTSKQWVLPPRPKPGRKPASESSLISKKKSKTFKKQKDRNELAKQINNATTIGISSNSPTNLLIPDTTLNSESSPASQPIDISFPTRLDDIHQRFSPRNTTLTLISSKDGDEGFSLDSLSSATNCSSQDLLSNAANLRRQNDLLKQALEDSSYENQRLKGVIDRLRSQLDLLNDSSNEIQKSFIFDTALNSSSRYDEHRDLIKQEPDSSAITNLESAGCGLCDSGGNCVCDELGLKSDPSVNLQSFNPLSFGSMDKAVAVPLRKRPHSSANSSIRKFKRLRDSVEVDFTSTFSKPSGGSSNGDNSQNSMSAKNISAKPLDPDTNDSRTGDSGSSSTPSGYNDDDDTFSTEAKSSSVDPCGFCSNGTPCLCAGTSAADDVMNDEMNDHLEPLSDSISGPDTNDSGVDSSGSSSRSSHTSKSEPPGSCPQCLKDPMCTLFCTSLANYNKLSKSDSEDPAISCSEAYKTISRHREFPNADLSKIVNNLEVENGKVNVSSISLILKDMNKRP